MTSLQAGRRAYPAESDLDLDSGGPDGLILVDRQPAPVVRIANRLPIVRVRGGWRSADGGLVSALLSTFDARPGVWVGWDGGTTEVAQKLPEIAAGLVPLSLRRAELEGYYYGFSNRTLWPLFHGLTGRVVIDRSWWQHYMHVNERFTERAYGAATASSLFWVHDYQLACVPGLLRRRSVEQPVGFFLHIPFPAPDVYARLPWRNDLMDGMLGADVIGFQTEEYRQNFVRGCSRLRDDISVDGPLVRLADGRSVLTATHPISIDVQAVRARTRSDVVTRAMGRLRSQFGTRRVLVGVDRLDYTKGIVERLRAVELLLERRREFRGRLSVLQIAAPSRGDIREYRMLRSEVEEIVGRINGRFTRPGEDVPVHYLYRSLSPTRLLACYGIADVCLVTPLRDGMNLVAKEFVVCQQALGQSGVLLLSEFAGAAAELREALLCNPFDVEGLSETLELALESDEDDRRHRIERLAARVARHDVFDWFGQEVETLEASTTTSACEGGDAPNSELLVPGVRHDPLAMLGNGVGALTSPSVGSTRRRPTHRRVTLRESSPR